MTLREAVATIDPENKEVLVEGLGELGAVIIATFVFRRKLRRLGYSEKEIYALSAVVTSLYWARLHLNGIRKELRRKRLAESRPSSASRRP